MPADAKLNRLIDRRDAIDGTIEDIESVGIAKAGFDGLQEVTNIEIERLQLQRVDLNRRIVQRMAWLNGRNPFLMGSRTRRFQPDARTAAPTTGSDRDVPDTPVDPSEPVDPVTPTSITIRAGWSLNDTVDGADLSDGTSFTGAGPTLTFAFPDTSDDGYPWLAVPHSQDDLNYFHFTEHETNQFGAYMAVASVAYQGGAWKVWRSEELLTDPAVLADVEVEVGSR